MQGKIIKGIAGFYYVHDGIGKVYECHARGVFRNRNIKPLVGDDVEFSILDEAEGKLKFTDGTAIPFRDLTGIHILHRKDESQ